jgi:phospholipid transport system transporter-binding protein
MTVERAELAMTAPSMFEIGATLTFETAKAVLDAGLARIAAGATRVDCAPLERFDSSALAVLLAWRRAAQARGTDLMITHLPPGLASLAEAYGITSLVTASAAARV